jgi:LDH2 family malate/lactate/ureidoglycolate dehydrogenase
MMQEIEARRRREGIPVPGRTWHGFCRLAKKLHVEETLPSPVTQAPPLAAKL